jgi:hypothetical protein
MFFLLRFIIGSLIGAFISPNAQIWVGLTYLNPNFRLYILNSTTNHVYTIANYIKIVSYHTKELILGVRGGTGVDILDYASTTIANFISRTFNQVCVCV